MAYVAAILLLLIAGCTSSFTGVCLMQPTHADQQNGVIRANVFCEKS